MLITMRNEKLVDKLIALAEGVVHDSQDGQTRGGS
jgi:hypothetical protein